MRVVRLLSPEPVGWLCTTNFTRSREPTSSWNQYHSLNPKIVVCLCLSSPDCLSVLSCAHARVSQQLEDENVASHPGDSCVLTRSFALFVGAIWHGPFCGSVRVRRPSTA